MSSRQNENARFANLSPVTFNHVRLEGGFWQDRINAVRRNTVSACLDQCEKTGRIANFRRAAGIEKGPFEGIYFNDSDLYKVLEGVAYVLANERDETLEARADAIIADICAAQQADGYLNTYYILTGIENRWSDMGYHEAYCLGHMIEGAIAYDQATGKDKWLKTAIRAAEQMMDTFGPGKRHWITGHQEIELALIRLYRYTGQERFLDYAKFLVDERGHGYLRSELFRQMGMDEGYCQDDLPARALSRVTGHSVRAMYYYSAITDIASICHDSALAGAVQRLWNNVNPANLYITGGIGQDSRHEGFTRDFSLPNLTAYCETCAAIGMAMWNQRMNLMTADAKYADLVEREIYNGALSGISLDGSKFFYDNPLSSVGKYSRSEWFGCSCCPTNLMRFIPSIAGYAYAMDSGSVYVNQFIPGAASATLENGTVEFTVHTGYPYNGEVEISIRQAGPGAHMRIRCPGWCREYALYVNGARMPAEKAANGYVETPIRASDQIRLSLKMPVRFTRADERVAEDRGRIAVEKGPFVFCAEETDNPGLVREYFHAFKQIDPNAAISVWHDENLLNGIDVVRVGDTVLIPYYAWNNRGAGAMAVWLLEKN